jgi:hypothetical protein
VILPERGKWGGIDGGIDLAGELGFAKTRYLLGSFIPCFDLKPSGLLHVRESL